ncbi:MAG TPA: hypothetical protein VGC77_22170 [Rhodopseudomonas sp.]|uniref:hypothetical protein n=1 Tax=Rhodopseudomonas sp. TaxID=1078 RepID=UPI002ED9584E
MARSLEVLDTIDAELCCEHVVVRSRRETRPAITTIILILLVIEIVIDVLTRRRGPVSERS